jgi:tetratricopeptide (TPR) repeat protein
VHNATGNYPAASASFREALSLYRQLGNRRGEITVLIDLGILQRLTGDYEAAAASLTESLTDARELSDPPNQARALIYLGEVLRLTGEYQSATATLTEALTLETDLGHRIGIAVSFVQLDLTGDRAAAEASLNQGLDGCREAGDRLSQAQALAHLGALLADTARPGDGLARYHDALSIARDIGAPREQADALDGIGRCLIGSGDLTAGVTSLRQALAI